VESDGDFYQLIEISAFPSPSFGTLPSPPPQKNNPFFFHDERGDSSSPSEILKASRCATGKQKGFPFFQQPLFRGPVYRAADSPPTPLRFSEVPS